MMTRMAIALASLVLAVASAASQAPPSAVPDGFTFAAGGDLIGPYHTLQGVDDPPFSNGVTPLFKNADVGFANQEGSIFDLETFAGSPAAENGGGIPQSPLAVAHDLKAIGVTMVSKANNHATDWGTQGLVVSQQSLVAAGIAFAGSGMSEAEARAPAYVETPKGKAALVATASTFTRMSVAGPPGMRRGHPTRPRPGISALHVEEIQFRPADQVAALRAIVYGGSGARRGDSDQVDLGDQIFRASARHGVTWEMNKTDEAAIITSVREARKNAGFVLFSIHAHQTGGPAEDPGLGSPVDHSDEAEAPNDPRPADFEPALFHEAIDAGADAVVRTGPHLLNGIEIYKGKPIFYCLGSLFFDFQGRRSYTVPTGQTLTFPDEWFETVVPVTTYKGGRVSEIKLYPMVIESSNTPTGGAPHPANPDQARHILERLKTLSAVFGTQISIENNIGIIRSALRADRE
jgi:poly-gamma-glutamate capsule biosynthesis protein CapA/YwtB (metallophosphatase superfamily)